MYLDKPPGQATIGIKVAMQDEARAKYRVYSMVTRIGECRLKGNEQLPYSPVHLTVV